MRTVGHVIAVVLAAVAVSGPGSCRHRDDDELSHRTSNSVDAGNYNPFDPAAPNCGLVEVFDAGPLTSTFPEPCPPGEPLLAPQSFTRERGSPEEQHRAFTLDPGGPCCIDVQNNGVASANIGIDAKRNVLGPGDFNPNISHISARKNLAAGEHVLNVELRSAPGSSLTVSINRALTPPPLPSGVLAQGPATLLQLTALDAQPRGISPKNQDSFLDAAALSADFRVAVPERFAREPQEHLYRVEYTWKVASDACGVVRFIKATQPIPLPPAPSDDDDGDDSDGEKPEENSSSSSSSGGEDHGNNDESHGTGHGDDHGSSSGSHSSSSSRASSSSSRDDHGDHPDFDAMLWAPFSVTGVWDGKDDAGAWVPDGTYKVFLEAVVIRTEIDDDDDSDGDGVLDRDEHAGTSRPPEPPEDHLVDGLVSPFVPALVDNTPPTVSLGPIPAYTNQNPLPVDVTTEPNATVTVRSIVPPRSPFDTPAPTGAVTIPVPLSHNQLNMFTVTAVDVLRNRSTPPLLAATTHDDIPPKITVTEPADNAVVAWQQVSVIGTVRDINPLASIGIVDGLSFIPGGTGPSFNMTIQLPNEEVKTFTVVAVDVAGNTAEVVRHIRRAPLCVTNADCPPVNACNQEAACNSGGFCEVRTLGGPPAFCTVPDGGQPDGGNATLLWTWSCSITDAGATRWSCDLHRNCGSQEGCFASRCVQGENECVQDPVTNGTPCAAPGDGGVLPQARCLDENRLMQPTCIGGQCIMDSALAEVDCRDQPGTDCSVGSCAVRNGVAQCIRTPFPEGTLCGPCSGAGAACDACLAPYTCNGTGACTPGPAPDCSDAGPCMVGFCDPFAPLVGNVQSLCRAQERVCAGGQLCSTVDGGCP